MFGRSNHEIVELQNVENSGFGKSFLRNSVINIGKSNFENLTAKILKNNVW